MIFLMLIGRHRLYVCVKLVLADLSTDQTPWKKLVSGLCAEILSFSLRSDSHWSSLRVLLHQRMIQRPEWCVHWLQMSQTLHCPASELQPLEAINTEHLDGSLMFYHTFLLVFIHCSRCGWSALLEGTFRRRFLFNQLGEHSGAAALCWWPFTSELKTNTVQRKTNVPRVLVCLPEGSRFSRKPQLIRCMFFYTVLSQYECTVPRMHCSPPLRAGLKGEVGPKCQSEEFELI